MYSQEKMDTRARRKERQIAEKRENAKMSYETQNEEGKREVSEGETSGTPRKEKGEKQMNKKETVERINLRRLPLRRCFPVVHARDFPPPLHGAISNIYFVYFHFFIFIRVAFNQAAIFMVQAHDVSIFITRYFILFIITFFFF